MNTFVVPGVISCEREIPKHRSGYLLEMSAHQHRGLHVELDTEPLHLVAPLT
jgi:hypothetical protein